MHLQIIQDVSQLQEAPKAKGIVVALTLLPGKEATVCPSARARLVARRPAPQPQRGVAVGAER